MNKLTWSLLGLGILGLFEIGSAQYLGTGTTGIISLTLYRVLQPVIGEGLATLVVTPVMIVLSFSIVWLFAAFYFRDKKPDTVKENIEG